MKQAAHRFPVSIVVLATVIVLLGVGWGLFITGWWAAPPRNAIQDEIDQDLQHHAGARRVVDLNVLLTEEWTRAIVVCGGTRQDLDRALGFEWEGPDPSSPGFLSMLVLADDHEVLDYFATGQDDMFVDQWYFTVCTVPVDPDYGQVADAVIAVDRDDAQIEFRSSKSAGGPFWYVPSSELLRLEALGK